MYLNIHGKVVLDNHAYLNPDGIFVATLTEIDRGGTGKQIGLVNIMAESAQDLIDLGHDLMLAGREMQKLAAADVAPLSPSETRQGGYAHGDPCDKAA